MEGKLFSALSLSRKAGALTPGFDAVCGDVNKGKAALVLFASDLSPATRRRAARACEGACPLRDMPLTQQDVSRITHKPVGILAVTNQDLAALCLASLPQEEEQI